MNQILVDIWALTTDLSSGIWWLMDQNIFSGIITLLVGLKAYSVYTKQKRDHKRDIASTILLEITNATSEIEELNRRLQKEPNILLADDIKILSSNSWTQHKSLFVSDLTRIEWDAISDFYRNSSLLDDAINYNKTFFKKNEEQLRANLHRIATDISLEATTSKDINIKQKHTSFYKNLLSLADLSYLENTFYSPRKPLLDAQQYLRNLNNNLTLTTLYSKFENISKEKVSFLKNLWSLIKE